MFVTKWFLMVSHGHMEPLLGGNQLDIISQSDPTGHKLRKH